MKRRIIFRILSILGLTGMGLALGIWFGHEAAHTGGNSHAHVREHANHNEHDHDLVVLSRQAFENLGLQIAKVRREDYERTIRVPGEVVEIPGRTSRTIAAPVGGVVDRIYVEAGQLVRPTAVLMEMEITDEQLIAGQVALVDVVSRLEVAAEERDRLSPLAESGTVAGRRRLELDYQTRQLEAQLAARVQELELRGLTAEQTASVRENRQLIKRIVVRLPTIGGDSARTQEDAALLVEDLGVHPGMSVQRGDELCRLADHRWLYIRGEAFEGDVESIAGLTRRGWTVRAEFGHQHHKGHEHLQRQEGLQVAYVDNHVDPATRTFRFYLRLANEVEQERTSDSGEVFREWRYKPGQIAHLFAPVERWEQQITLPLAAVVEEGPNAFVFREHEDDHPPGAADHDHTHPYIEFEPVPVRVLYRDDRHAVLADDGQLRPGDVVAVNQAYQLHLALKMQSAEGGHHHEH